MSAPTRGGGGVFLFDAPPAPNLTRPLFPHVVFFEAVGVDGWHEVFSTETTSKKRLTRKVKAV